LRVIKIERFKNLSIVVSGMDVKRKGMGYLTREDLDMLEQASARVLKHKKTFVAKSTCKSCSYSWFYDTIKCPSCESKEIKMEKKKE